MLDIIKKKIQIVRFEFFITRFTFGVDIQNAWFVIYFELFIYLFPMLLIVPLQACFLQLTNNLSYDDVLMNKVQFGHDDVNDWKRFCLANNVGSWSNSWGALMTPLMRSYRNLTCAFRRMQNAQNSKREDYTGDKVDQILARPNWFSFFLIFIIYFK